MSSSRKLRNYTESKHGLDERYGQIQESLRSKSFADHYLDVPKAFDLLIEMDQLFYQFNALESYLTTSKTELNEEEKQLLYDLKKYQRHIELSMPVRELVAEQPDLAILRREYKENSKEAGKIAYQVTLTDLPATSPPETPASSQVSSDTNIQLSPTQTSPTLPALLTSTKVQLNSSGTSESSSSGSADTSGSTESLDLSPIKKATEAASEPKSIYYKNQPHYVPFTNIFSEWTPNHVETLFRSSPIPYSGDYKPIKSRFSVVFKTNLTLNHISYLCEHYGLQRLPLTEKGLDLVFNVIFMNANIQTPEALMPLFAQAVKAKELMLTEEELLNCISFRQLLFNSRGSLYEPEAAKYSAVNFYFDRVYKEHSALKMQHIFYGKTNTHKKRKLDLSELSETISDSCLYALHSAIESMGEETVNNPQKLNLVINYVKLKFGLEMSAEEIAVSLKKLKQGDILKRIRNMNSQSQEGTFSLSVYKEHEELISKMLKLDLTEAYARLHDVRTTTVWSKERTAIIVSTVLFIYRQHILHRKIEAARNNLIMLIQIRLIKQEKFSASKDSIEAWLDILVADGVFGKKVVRFLRRESSKD